MSTQQTIWNPARADVPAHPAADLLSALHHPPERAVRM